MGSPEGEAMQRREAEPEAEPEAEADAEAQPELDEDVLEIMARDAEANPDAEPIFGAIAKIGTKVLGGLGRKKHHAQQQQQQQQKREAEAEPELEDLFVREFGTPEEF